MSQMVRAAVLEEPGKFAVHNYPRPEIEPDALLLRVTLAGVCGSDRHMYMGRAKASYPVLPGHEVVGIVEEIGPLANDTMNVIGGPIAVGDQITVVPSSKTCGKCFFCRNQPTRPTLCSSRTVHGFRNCANPPHLVGAFAEYMYVSGSSWVCKVNDMAPELAVLSEPAAIATRAVDRAMAPGIPNMGEGYGMARSAVVQGVGPIGLLIVAALAFTGADPIIAVDSVPGRLEMAKSLGAHVAVNLKECDAAARLDRVKDLTEGVGADVVFEATGVPAAFAEALELVRRGGKVIEVGHYTDAGTVEIRPYAVCSKDVDIHGSFGAPPIQFKESISFLRRSDKPLGSLITHTFGLEQVEDAIKQAASPDALKVVLRP